MSLNHGNSLPKSSGRDRRGPAVVLATNVATSSPPVSFSTRCPECGKSVGQLSAHLMLHTSHKQMQPRRNDPALHPGSRGPNMDSPKQHPPTATTTRARGAAPSSSIDLTDDEPVPKRRKLTPPTTQEDHSPISEPTCPLPPRLLRTNEPKRTVEWLRLYFVPDASAIMELNTILQVYEDAFAPYKARYQRLGEPKFRKTFRATFEHAVVSRQAGGAYLVHGVRSRDVVADRGTTSVSRQKSREVYDDPSSSPPSTFQDRMERVRPTHRTPVKEVQNHHAAPHESPAVLETSHAAEKRKTAQAAHESPALLKANHTADKRTAAQASPPRISYLSRSLPDWFLKVDEPKRSAEWLRLYFEPHPVSELGVTSLLQAYYNAFASVAASHPHLVGPKFFALCQSIFTNVTFGSSPSGTYMIKGIKARAAPAGSATLRAQFAPSGEQRTKDKDANGDEDGSSHTGSKLGSVPKALDAGVEQHSANAMSTPTLPGSKRHGESPASAPQSTRQGSSAIAGVPKHRSPWHGACEGCRSKGKDHSFCWVSSRLYPGQGGRRVPGSGTTCGRCLKEGIPCVDVLRDGRVPDSGARRRGEGDGGNVAVAGASARGQNHVKAMPDVMEADSEVDLHYARMIHEKRISSETFSQLFRAHGIDPVTALIKWRSLVELGRTNR